MGAICAQLQLSDLTYRGSMELGEIRPCIKAEEPDVHFHSSPGRLEGQIEIKMKTKLHLKCITAQELAPPGQEKGGNGTRGHISPSLSRATCLSPSFVKGDLHPWLE